jgi:hypothetical protein
MSVYADFETHPIGTAKEIRLSRELMDEITEVVQAYEAGIFPIGVLKAYHNLLAHYEWQMENE